MKDDVAIRWYEKDLQAMLVRQGKEPANPAMVKADPYPDPPRWHELDEAQKIAIRARVRAVLLGDVRRCEMGPADLDVYFGRYRVFDPIAPHEAVSSILSRLRKRGVDGHPMVEYHRGVLWDCVEFNSWRPPVSSHRLFGNANVGDYVMCNLQHAGQMGEGSELSLYGWHASIEVDPGVEDIAGRLIEGATVRLIIGDKPVAERHLRDLFNEPFPIQAHVPPMQTFGVHVEFNDHRFLSLAREVGGQADWARGSVTPCRIWIHLEGWHLNY